MSLGAIQRLATETASDPNDEGSIARATVQIEVRRHCACLPASVFDVLRPALETNWHRWRPGGPRGYRHEDALIRHYLVRDGKLFVSAGLVPLISEHLSAAGYGVDVDDRTIWKALRRAQPVATQTVAGADWEFCQEVMRSPRGQLHYHCRDAGYHQLALLCDMFERERIFVVSKNRRNAGAVYRKLRRRLLCAHRLQLDPLQAMSAPGGILCSTSYWLALANRDDWDIIVCADPEAALAQQARERLAILDDQLRYCLVPANYAAGWRTKFLLEELFGRPLLLAPAEQLADVYVVPVASGAAKSKSARSVQTTLERLRARWDDPVRCGLIRDMAVQLAAGRPVANGTREQVDALSLPAAAAGNVIVLTDTVAHARALQEVLPGWHVVADTPVAGEELDGYHLAVTGPAISTSAHADMYGIAADVVIWAGGAAWPLGYDAFPRPAMRESDRVLLIDIVDSDDHPAAHSDTMRRLGGYRDRGWQIVEHPVVSQDNFAFSHH